MFYQKLSKIYTSSIYNSRLKKEEKSKQISKLENHRQILPFLITRSCQTIAWHPFNNVILTVSFSVNTLSKTVIFFLIQPLKNPTLRIWKHLVGFFSNCLKWLSIMSCVRTVLTALCMPLRQLVCTCLRHDQVCNNH